MTDNSLPEVSVVEREKADLREPLVIAGFAGPGLVGGIAMMHLIQELGLRDIAHVKSRHMPPAVVFIDGMLRHPFRIYANDTGDLVAIVSEMPLPSDSAMPLASALLDWAETKGVKEVAVLEGVPVSGLPSERKSYCAAEPEKVSACKEHGIEMINSGLITGIAGSILNECLTRKITGVVFLTPANATMPDPQGAAVLIDALNRVYGLDVDTTALVERAEEIRKKLEEVAQRRQQMLQQEMGREAPEAMYG